MIFTNEMRHSEQHKPGTRTAKTSPIWSEATSPEGWSIEFIHDGNPHRDIVGNLILLLLFARTFVYQFDKNFADE